MTIRPLLTLLLATIVASANLMLFVETTTAARNNPGR